MALQSSTQTTMKPSGMAADQSRTLMRAFEIHLKVPGVLRAECISLTGNSALSSILRIISSQTLHHSMPDPVVISQGTATTTPAKHLRDQP